jgi:FADH2 O2-dependent halogenase
MKSYDVAILGSGFSGTVLGTILARHGISVVLIDGQTHPRFAIGESTIPHTSLLLSLLGQRYGVPEIDDLAYPDRIAERVCSTCGIKRSFGFAFHRPGQEYDPREGLQFGTSSKDENHFFRQDIDSYLVNLAVSSGADLRLGVFVDDIEIDGDGVRLTTTAGEALGARYIVDGTGRASPLAERFDLRDEPTRFEHHSRALFTHMVDVSRFRDDDPSLTLPWHQSTLHHVFEGGWFWVIPFNNREGATNPLVSVGLTLDPRLYPKDDAITPEEEFRRFAARYPSVAETFTAAKAVRPWVSTGRLQYSSRKSVGYRYCLMSSASGTVDALFSRGLINTVEVIQGLLEPLMAALADDDFSEERFAPIEELHRNVLTYNDRLVSRSFTSFADFDLWNAWLRVWALGTILTEFRLMNAVSDYTASGDPADLEGEAKSPAFSEYEDPDYAAFFDRSVDAVDEFAAGRLSAADAAKRIFDSTADYEFPVVLRRSAMRRAGWLGESDVMSDRAVGFARTGYRWAITNPTTRDLYGNAETFFRWRVRRADPHVMGEEAPPRFGQRAQ